MDAHHIRHWVDGGETSLENTMLPCSVHHRLVHEGGYEIRKDASGGWYFRRSDGRAVPRCGYHPDDMVDDMVDTGGASAEAPGSSPEDGSVPPNLMGVQEVTPTYAVA